MKIDEYMPETEESKNITAMRAALVRWEVQKGLPFTLLREEWSFKGRKLRVFWITQRPGHTTTAKSGIACNWDWDVPEGITVWCDPEEEELAKPKKKAPRVYPKVCMDPRCLIDSDHAEH